MLRDELRGRESGGVYLTTIQKFTEDIQLLTDRSNVICISDEAHRSQINLKQKQRNTDEGIRRTYGFAKYLHDSLPNATYVGFTGTPVDATIEVFGNVVDAYTMTEAVQDGITVNLVYDGRAARVMLDQNKVREIEDYYAKCAEEGANEYQIEESQKAVAHLDVILGDPDRLRSVAEDFIAHYEGRVAEGATVAGKAMFVCSNRNIAYALYKIVVELRPEWAEKKVCPDGVELSEKDKKELKPIEMVKMVMTRNKDDDPILYQMLGTKEDRKELDRQFKNVKSNFKIAIVVDMWLTGFDVPCLDTIYIDKPIQQHTLIQTISRVNRVYEGKDKGLIVDYLGIKKNMNMKKAFPEREFSVSAQDRKYHLFDYPGKRFLMRPDLVVTRKTDGAIFVMDTKWKLLSANKPHYGISQPDMYQMYAYQKKYGAENITLLYPLTDEVPAGEEIVFQSKDGVTVRVEFIDLFRTKDSLTKVLEELQVSERI